MKRMLIAPIILLFLIGGASLLTAQSGNLQDGFYFAQADEFSNGWKYVVMFDVRNGRITNVDWDGANERSGPSKDVVSERGDYGMVARGNAQAEWHVQARRMERWLERSQNPRAIRLDSDGNTDAVSGVSIHVNEFQDLAIKAIEKGPVGRGDYRDGYYEATGNAFSHGWKDKVGITVLGGRIVSAHWTALAEGGGKDKYQASMDGEYGMLQNGDAQAAWYEQADRAAARLVREQSPNAVRVNSDGSTDAISGVSITVGGFYELAEKALRQGPES